MKSFWWPAFKAWIVKERALVVILCLIIILIWSVSINYSFYKGVYHYFADQDKVALRSDSTQVASANQAVDTLIAERERLKNENVVLRAWIDTLTAKLWALPRFADALSDTVSFVRGYEAGLERAAALATLESQKGFAWDVVSIYWYDSTDQFAESNTATGKRVTITKVGNFYGDTTESHLQIGIYDNKKGKVRY